MLTLPIRERDETRRSLRFVKSLSLSHYERGIRRLCHILFLRFSLSPNTRVRVASFLSPRREMLTLPIRERDETRRSLRFVKSLSLSHYERVSIYLSSRRERD